MPKSAWPTGTELTNAVAGVGGSIPSGYAAADLIAAAVSEWERKTGWAPFLADAGTTTLQFDPTFAYTLRLPGFFTITTVTVDGIAQTEGTDYWATPYNNTTTMKPITSLRFREPLTGEPRSISVTGRRGYDDDIHEDVWMAVLNRAVARCLELAAGVSGSASRVKQGLVEVEYGQGQDTITRFNNEFKAVVAQYKRAEVF